MYEYYGSTIWNGMIIQREFDKILYARMDCTALLI